MVWYSESLVGLSKQSRYRILAFILCGLVAVSLLWTRLKRDDSRLISITSLEYHPQIRKNIAVASGFGAHFDVYMALVWTLERVMKNEGKVQVYARTPFMFDFNRIVEEYHLYNGTFKHHDDLLRDINNDAGDGGIDMVILGTCEIDMRNWSKELLSAWDSRDALHKFQLVCIVHNALDNLWQATILEWSRRNAIRLLPISEHVGRTFHSMFEDRSRSPDPALNSAGLEYIPIDFHVPILDISGLPSLSMNRPLSNAVIQGSFEIARRDYPRIFAELIKSLHESPGVWGFLPLGNGSSFVPDPSDDYPPFRLHLVGHGVLEVPTELKDLVVFHTNLNYTDFYYLMGGMDVCIPAFKSDIDDNFRFQASSTIAMCLESNVPIFASRQLRESYTYADDDRITITYPAGMSEIQVLKALRTGDASSFLESDPSHSGIALGSHPRLREDVDRMMKLGWVRSKEGIDACKQTIWKANEAVVAKILRDL